MSPATCSLRVRMLEQDEPESSYARERLESYSESEPKSESESEVLVRKLSDNLSRRARARTCKGEESGV